MKKWGIIGAVLFAVAVAFGFFFKFDGSIIIMDDKDLTMFVNLLNEDYYISPVNGRRYEIKSKKLLGEPDGEPPRG